MLVLGVDGGGSKTQALALNEHGTILASGRAGRSNYRQVGLDAALDVIETLSRQILDGRRPDAAVFCLSDCDTYHDEIRLCEGLQRRGVVDRFACYNDAFAVLRAGSSQAYGVAVICGTGFNACGIGIDGRRASLHSLGTLTGDWGGGYDLGAAMCGAVFRAAEGRGEATILTDLLFTALAVSDLDTLTEHIMADRLTTAQITLLAPLVFEAARAGDAAALGIVHRQAEEIAIAARAMLRRLDLLTKPVDVVLGGGIVQGNGTLLPELVRHILMPFCPLARIETLTVAPVVGAAFLAFDLLGIVPPVLGQPVL